MKKCPYCAEEIQDEAILCRFCGHDLPARHDDTEQPEALSSQIQSSYDSLLTSLGAANQKDLHRYPLSVHRRPQVIADIVVRVESGPVLDEVTIFSHYFWWNTAHDKKMDAYIWQEEAQRILMIPSTDPLFPTEEEWLSAIALILVRAESGGYAPKVFVMDWLRTWQHLQKAKRIDRIISGFTFFGALSNIASSFLPKKLPKEGSFNWHACRHAYAKIEASVVQELIIRSS